MAIGLLAGACVLAASTAARAQSPPELDRWTDRRFAVEGHLGSGPIGLLGFALDLTAARWLAINAGFGAGASGGQLALSARPRLVFGALALALDAGWSAGPHEYDRCGAFCIDCEETEYGEWHPAHWLNVGGSCEYRALGGFVLRLYAGAGKLLNTGQGACNGDLGVSACPDQGRPFVGIALGYAPNTSRR
jgi:hypothetical protein